VNEAAAREARELQAPSASILEVQVEALLALVNERRDQRTKEIRAKSDAQAREILQTARAEARESLHQAVARERALMTQGLRQAQARAELESRQRAQRETLTLLGHMWERIGGALEARWAEERARVAWIAAAVQEAAQLLPGRPWRMEHAAGVPREEQAPGGAQMRADGAQDVEWHREPQIRAGLRVRTSGACLDATVEGLLAHREDIEALFLFEYLSAGACGAAERSPTAAADAPQPPAAPGALP
jgi:hypothetical protein